MEWKVDKSSLHSSFKGLCVGRKDTLKISIARIPFLCAVFMLPWNISVCNKEENAGRGKTDCFLLMFRSQQLPCPTYKPSTVFFTVYACWLPWSRQHNTYTQNTDIKTWCISTGFSSPSSLLTSSILVSGIQATGSSTHWAINTPLKEQFSSTIFPQS